MLLLLMHSKRNTRKKSGAPWLAAVMPRSFQASIVVPLLDQRDEWLEQCLRSAVEQSARCEVIVVHSPRVRQSNLDLVAGLKREFDNLVLTPEKPGRGFPGAINVGIALASADRIGLLLSDDWLERDAVEQCLGHPGDIVSTGQTSYAADGATVFEEISRVPCWRTFEDLPSLERKASYLSHFFLFRKHKLQEIGGADEDLGDIAGAGIDDFEMIWTLLEHGATVSIVERSLYNYRDHSDERLTLRRREDSLAGLERILSKHRVTPADRARIVAAHSRWYGEPIHRVHDRLKARG